MIAVSEASNRSNTQFRPLLKFDKWPAGRKRNKAYAVLTQHPALRKTSYRRPAAKIWLSSLQVDNIFVFIRQVAPVPACWLFKISATS